MDELIQRIAAATGVEPAKAETAISMIFAFLRKEGPTADVDALLAELPGGSEAAAGADVKPASTSLLGGLMGAFGGGGLMGLAGRLTDIGLSMNEIQAIGKEVFAFAREKVGDERVGKIKAAIPGLSQII